MIYILLYVGNSKKHVVKNENHEIMSNNTSNIHVYEDHLDRIMQECRST